jgi:carboxymethylenebutenolidase
VPADPGAGATGGHASISAPDGASLAVYLAHARARNGSGIVVLPDYHGLTPFYEALALRFAEVGVAAVAVDYYGRSAPPPPRGRDFDHVAHAARTTWAGLQADAVAAAELLRRDCGVERLYSVGFCFGGRTSFLLGTRPELALSGVIGFYGWPVGTFANDSPAPADVVEQLRCPLLGIFGGADTKISPSDVATFEDALEAAPVAHRVLTFEGAPHSFFDRAQAAHGEAAAAAWAEVLAFIGARPGPARS